MPSTNWLDSIDWPHGSSSGQLPTLYDKRLDHVLWNEDPFDPFFPIQARFNATVSSPGEQISFWLDANDETALRRFIGCWILTVLPDEALTETLASLRDILEFYVNVPEKTLPETRREITEGHVVGAKKRGDLILEE